MISWKKNLCWTWLSLFLAMAGFAFAYPIMPFLLEDVYHVTDTQTRDLYISLFAFSGNFGFFIFSPIWGRLADIYGKKMMMTRANLCSAIFLPLIALMPTANMLVILRLIIGAFAGVASAAMTLVACTTPEKHRGMALGAISSAIFSGNLAGVVLGGFAVNAFGYTPTFMLCGVMMLMATFISHFLIMEDIPSKAERPTSAFSIKLRIPKFGMIWYIMGLTLVMGYVQQLDAPFIPVLVKEVVNSTNAEAMRWNGILGGAAAAAGILGGFLIGTLADHFPGQKVGIIISLMAALFMLPQYWCDSLPFLFGERMVMIFFVSGLSPIMQTWLSLTTDPKQRGAFFGYATSFRAMGWLLGGVAGALATRYASTRAVFALGAISLLATAGMIALVQRKLPFPARGKKRTQ